MAKPKYSPLTSVVLKSRQKYVDILDKIATSRYAEIPYMKQRVDPRTRDKQLVQMNPEQLLQMDPTEAAQAATRLRQLQARSLAKPQNPSEAEYEE